MIRRQTPDFDKPYDETGDDKGFNPAALIAMAVGVGAAPTFSPVPRYVGVIPAGVSPELPMRHMPAARRVLDG